MICPICKHGNTIKGFATMTFERDKTTVVFKRVPAEICDNCNEAYISEDISKKLIEQVDQEVKKGIEIEVLRYVA